MFPPAPIDVKLVLVQQLPMKNLATLSCRCLYADWAIKEQELVRWSIVSSHSPHNQQSGEMSSWPKILCLIMLVGMAWSWAAKSKLSFYLLLGSERCINDPHHWCGKKPHVETRVCGCHDQAASMPLLLLLLLFYKIPSWLHEQIIILHFLQKIRIDDGVRSQNGIWCEKSSAPHSFAVWE